MDSCLEPKEQHSKAQTGGRRYWCSRASIIFAKRMLSSILELTDGEDLISSLFKRTAAISEAAIKMALFAFFDS